jgi:hypothetical protein
MGVQGFSDTQLKIGTRAKNVAWYSETIDRLGDPTRKPLEKYSKVPADEVEAHIYKVVRSEAFSHNMSTY